MRTMEDKKVSVIDGVPQPGKENTEGAGFMLHFLAEEIY